MRQVLGGSTDVSTNITIVDSSDGTPETGVTSVTAGLALEYVRLGAAPVSITESDLVATNSAHTDGGMKHLGYGHYRLDLPDAAVATGVDTVDVIGTVTGMIVLRETLQITGYNPRTELTSTVLARIDENISAAKTLTAGALTNVAASVWNALTSGMSTASSIGKKLADWALGTDGKVLLSSNAQTGVTIPTVTTVTNAVTAGTVSDKTGYSLSAGGIQAIWDALTSALTTAGSIGKLLVDNVNATISSRSSHSAADVWSSVTRTLTSGGGASAADIWNHLMSAITANDGSIGGFIEYRLDAAVSSIITAVTLGVTAITNNVNGSTVTARRGDKVDLNLTTNTFVFNTGDKLDLIIKPRDFEDVADTSGKIWIRKTGGGTGTDGLQYLNGIAQSGAALAKASLIYNSTVQTRVTINGDIYAQLVPGNYRFELQHIPTGTSDPVTVAEGDWICPADVVRSTS